MWPAHLESNLPADSSIIINLPSKQFGVTLQLAACSVNVL